MFKIYEMGLDGLKDVEKDELCVLPNNWLVKKDNKLEKVHTWDMECNKDCKKFGILNDNLYLAFDVE